MENNLKLSSKEKMLNPDFIFESSWEVCNKVGGIYTVLSTRAKSLQTVMPDRIVFIGPFFAGDSHNPYFEEDPKLLADWRTAAGKNDGLNIKVGRWNIPGRPIAVLVDFSVFYPKKNAIYTKLWELFGVDSLHAYGDYDEASMFSFAAARVVESYYRFFHLDDKRVVYHGNEWMTGLGLLYIRHTLPRVATLFTTHATSIGRSIAGNNKPLYDYLFAYNGDQMADELNMQSKHSIEKQTAHHVDCFTTVSDITAKECRELLDKEVDVVLPNGFEDDFVPKGAAFTAKRKAARKALLNIANSLTDNNLDDDTLIISTSGRYEFRNKGIDVFIEAMARLNNDNRLNRRIAAFIEVPGCTSDDRASGMMRYLGLDNRRDSRVVLILVPNYLTGDDGMLNMHYYDLLPGNDLTIYPSYYEPWGYTPLESIAFHVPCITTDLAGFGLWANTVKGGYSELEDGVKVIHRTDHNYHDVADSIKDSVMAFARCDKKTVENIRRKAFNLSKKALWQHFIAYYQEAYHIALTKAAKRFTI